MTRTTSMADELRGGRGLLQGRRVPSWLRPFFWRGTEKDPYAGLDLFIRGYMTAKQPPQDIFSLGKVNNWAVKTLAELSAYKRAAADYAYALQNFPEIVPASTAKTAFKDCFANGQTHSAAPAAASTDATDDDDDWGMASDEDDAPSSISALPADMSVSGSMFLASNSISGSLMGQFVLGGGDPSEPVIRRSTLQQRFLAKLTQVEATIAFVKEVIAKTDLGKFGAVGRANGRR